MGDFFSATLSIQRRADFEEHLKGCTECAACLRTYKKTIEGVRNTVKSHLPSTPVLKLGKPPQDYRQVELVDYLLN